jgi:hypothetical protein
MDTTLAPDGHPGAGLEFGAQPGDLSKVAIAIRSYFGLRRVKWFVCCGSPISLLCDFANSAAVRVPGRYFWAITQTMKA